MSGISIFSAGKAIINTLVRLSPIALYSGSAVSGLVFEDFRAIVLLTGFILNEAFSFGYRMMFQGIYNPQCALMKTQDDYFVLPAPITQTIGFFVGFFLMDMYNAGVFYPMRFFFLATAIIVTIYSRINVGCKNLLEAIYSSIVGMLLGVGYYSVIKEYYRRDFFKTEDSMASDSVTDFFNLGK